ncbi:cache domain-containing sensor histidine kinase [Paenibacillus hexagrammi]|uniref:histidine kinase n=1 Tax=Paenibacillus hexagrammi TaxID=2908839 RepID=A0ABY3SEP7_9BACL|nr:sensor histidine kinase [Paenibacillus sp. YPD9-1]UJF32463.1 sensor histidine kinase [Paenibacillus sp. YPD9-1]
MAQKYWNRAKQAVMGRLRNKLVFAFSLLVALIVILLSYLSFRQTVSLSEQSFMESNQKLLKLVNKNLDSYLSQIDELSLSPHKDIQFMDALYSDEYLGQFYIQNQMKNWFYSREDIERLTIYTPRNRQEYTISRSATNLVQHTDFQTESESWFQEAVHSPHFRSIEPKPEAGQERSNELLTFHRIIINIADKAPLAAVSITLNEKEFSHIIKDLSDDKEEAIAVFNDHNQPIYIKGSAFMESGVEELLQQVSPSKEETQLLTWPAHKDDLIMAHFSSGNQWKLLKLIPKEMMNQGAERARNMNLAIGSGFVVFAIVVTVFVSNAITRRLKLFSRHIERLGEGHFEPSAEIRGMDEVAHLSRKFNQMVVRIDDLIAERYELALGERNAKLKALEAQINPHFLYNSLQAISTEAIVNDMESIHSMVDALASSLRYCIRESDTVKVIDELAHISNYLLLQHARFGSRLHVRIEIEEEANECIIPKMSLQILLENAIEHALEQMSGPIHINITGEITGNRLDLQVSDDGPGITSERLEQIIAGFDEDYLAYQDSIGLKNLHSRLRLMFGSEASLTIRQNDRSGTAVDIGLPVRRESGMHV